jgi:predicted extracellular nuclease
LAAVVAAPATAAEPTVELLAETELAGDLEVDRTVVGGLSGLSYDPGCDLFYAISDDRGSLAPPRFYTLRIRFDGESAAATILGATLLRGSDGAPYARGEIDPEALALHTDGTLYLASEGVPQRKSDPLLGSFGLDGSFRGALSVPEHFLPDAGGTRGVRNNLGFEGLALSPDGSLIFAAAENALVQDGPVADLGVASPTRLLVIDLASGQPVAEHLYRVDPVPDEPRPPSAFRTNGISEILALDNERLLVLERSFSAGVGNQVRIYLVNLESAPNALEPDGLLDRPDASLAPIAKTLIADVREFGVEPDNIEGMALGPTLADGRRLLVLIADNNFQPSVQKNQILLMAISGVAPPVVNRPEPAIHDIQGATHVSPLVGRCVDRVGGVVTAILGRRGGQAFWIQDPIGDADPSTSEGLFVVTVDGLDNVEVGDRVRIGGRVEEPSWGMELPVTRLFATSLEIDDRRQGLPPPTVIGEGGVEIPQPDIASPRLEVFDPAHHAADAFESLEGMLVRVEEPVVVGPTSRYGEVVVLADGALGAAQRTKRGGVRMLDNNTNPQRIVIDDRLVAPPSKLRVGQALAGAVEGVLHYSFGSYKLLNIGPLPGVRDGGLEAERTDLTPEASDLILATFNLENVSAISESDKFARLAAIIADALGAPDIVAVQEVQDDSGPEDDGTVSSARTLELIVEAIEAAGGPHYDTRSIDPSDGADGGQPGGNIRTAFLFDPLRVEFVDRQACGADSGTDVADGPVLTCSPGLVNPGHRAFRPGEGDRSGSRKPLVGEFRVAGRQLFVVNLHLSSKGGDDPIFGRRQPRIENTRDRRRDQAQVVAGFVKKLTAGDPSARIVVLGDLNDFEGSEALLTLEAAGLEDLVRRLPLEDRYTSVYLGNSQVLDHILVSEGLAAGAEVEIVHANSEFPATDRASDHDPVIVRLSLER